jgi:hypothetical protein
MGGEPSLTLHPSSTVWTTVSPVDWVTAGSLSLLDLGYVALPALQRLISRQVYFICR